MTETNGRLLFILLWIMAIIYTLSAEAFGIVLTLYLLGAGLSWLASCTYTVGFKRLIGMRLLSWECLTLNADERDYIITGCARSWYAMRSRYRGNCMVWRRSLYRAFRDTEQASAKGR